MRGQESMELGQLTQTDQRGILYHMTTRSAIKDQGKEGGGHLWLGHFSSKVILTQTETLISRK